MSFNNIETKTINFQPYPPPAGNSDSLSCYNFSTSQSIPSATVTPVLFDTLYTSFGNIGLTTTDHITWVNNTSSTINVQVIFTLSFTSGAVAFAQYQVSGFVTQASLPGFQLGQNTCLNTPTPASTDITGTSILRIAPSDSFHISAYQDSGLSLALIANYTYLQILRLSS